MIYKKNVLTRGTFNLRDVVFFFHLSSCLLRRGLKEHSRTKRRGIENQCNYLINTVIIRLFAFPPRERLLYR